MGELEVRVLAELGRYTEAVAVLDELPGGSGHTGPQDQEQCPESAQYHQYQQSHCQESEAALLGAGLLPLLGAEHGSRAAAWYAVGLRQVIHDRSRLHLLADHIDFLRLTGNGPAAVELVRTHAALLRAGCTAAQRLRWLTSAAHAVAEQVDAGHGDDLVTVAWPERPTEPMTLAEFSAALHARATPLAAAFDARNGDRRCSLALSCRGRHDGARTTLSVDLRIVAPTVDHRRRRAGRRPVTLQDVLVCADPYAEAEEAVLSCTLVDPAGVWAALVLRAAGEGGAQGAGREAAARAVLARVLCMTGDRVRCLAEAATAAALSSAIGDRVAVAAAKATSAACWVGDDPHHGLLLARQAAAELTALPPGVERDTGLCRAGSAAVAALLALDRPDEAERWMAEVQPVHPGQQVRVASQRALVLRRRGRLPEAISVLHEGTRIADDHGLVALGVEIRLDLAEALEALGDTEGVIGVLGRTLLDLPHVPEPDPTEVPRTRMDLARVLAESGRLAPARIELERVRYELRKAVGTTQDLATADYLFGIVLHGLGDLTTALTHLEVAAAAFAQAQRPDGVALAERDRGAVLFLLDRSAEAAEAFDAAAAASRAAEADWQALACWIDAAQVRGYAGAVGAVEELRQLRAALPAAAASGGVADAELAFQIARVDHTLARCPGAGPGTTEESPSSGESLSSLGESLGGSLGESLPSLGESLSQSDVDRGGTTLPRH